MVENTCPVIREIKNLYWAPSKDIWGFPIFGNLLGGAAMQLRYAKDSAIHCHLEKFCLVPSVKRSSSTKELVVLAICQHLLEMACSLSENVFTHQGVGGVGNMSTSTGDGLFPQ